MIRYERWIDKEEDTNDEDVWLVEQLKTNHFERSREVSVMLESVAGSCTKACRWSKRRLNALASHAQDSDAEEEVLDGVSSSKNTNFALMGK